MAALVLAVSLLAACGPNDDDESASTTTAATGTTSEGGTAEPQPVDERIVVIGEEFLLADLLALGVKPVASTATVADAGFAGLDAYDTDGIDALPATERNLELLNSYEPDHIIVYDIFAQELGVSTLEGMADKVTVVPDGIDPVELVTMYGEMFGREEQAAELVTAFEAQAEAKGRCLTARRCRS